ncbi:MAG TPA: diaminopimelate decarboxylase [Clostridiales bacterium]|nr:diaminopimelate decarboxylase [Clostridiales bacterium]
MKKKLPFDNDVLKGLMEQYPTPFYLYDERAIRENVRCFNQAFSGFPDFQEYFAVKAAPNPHLMKIFLEEGCGVDCSSMAELILAERTGFTGENIYMSANDAPIEEFAKAKSLGAVINLDDITNIPFIEENIGLPAMISCRYNPGPLRTGNAIIGNPIEAKYGFTRDQIYEGYKILKEKGIQRFGIHTMVASNELNPEYFLETARMMFDLVYKLKVIVGVDIEVINLGGGLGIPYIPEDKPINYEALASDIKAIYDEKIIGRDLFPAKIAFESGRLMTGPYGYLVTKVLHKKETYKDYIGVDASMANLMRPALYNAYHHITVIGKENEHIDHKYDIVGSLCENNDKFAIDRYLPKLEIGDILVFHDVGAHGHCMGFNYNGKLRSAEILWQGGTKSKLIRRAETLDDYFATLDF